MYHALERDGGACYRRAGDQRRRHDAVGYHGVRTAVQLSDAVYHDNALPRAAYPRAAAV